MTPRRRPGGSPDELDLFGERDGAAAPPPVARATGRRASARAAKPASVRLPADDAVVEARGEYGYVVAEPAAYAEEIPGATPASAVSVGALTGTAKDVLEGAFVPLWVRGEVTDFKAHRNGHWYFALRDASAQIRCVVWARDQRRIPAPPDEGMEVAALGQLTVYASRGDLQLSVKALEAGGDGLWRKAMQLTYARLEGEGLMDPLRKRVIPRMPRRVAVVTSPDGAALHDIVAVVRRRCPTVEVVLVPARVQGDGAVEELCRAIEQAGRLGAVDTVIIGRGGGAREDLWAFNDERLARVLAACPVPTISAVGHEVDVTICDLVADLRAATPSAAAEAAVPVHAEALAHLRSLGERLGVGVRRRIDVARAELERAA
ncbi:MAG: Exodeoxyribonuclease VII large subunit, partial [uncultured Gemmatimonadaceae bacterium]